MTTLWTAHPDCPEHIKIELEARVRSLPPFFLLFSTAGEVFEDPNTCQERLQDWTLLQGFVIVRKSDSLKQIRSRFEFRCIHHEKNVKAKLRHSLVDGHSLVGDQVP